MQFNSIEVSTLVASNGMRKTYIAKYSQQSRSFYYSHRIFI